MTRPAAELPQAHKDAAWCVRQLRLRRWRYSLIASRLGVSGATVHRWRAGTSAPRSELRMQRLIALARAAMQVPPPTIRLVGMMVVVESVRHALHESARGLSRRLGMGESAIANWRATGHQPGYMATLKLRALASALPNREELQRLCDWRLGQISQRKRRIEREREQRLAAVQSNREAVARLRQREGVLPSR